MVRLSHATCQLLVNLVFHIISRRALNVVWSEIIVLQQGPEQSRTVWLVTPHSLERPIGAKYCDDLTHSLDCDASDHSISRWVFPSFLYMLTPLIAHNVKHASNPASQSSVYRWHASLS